MLFKPCSKSSFAAFRKSPTPGDLGLGSYAQETVKGGATNGTGLGKLAFYALVFRAPTPARTQPPHPRTFITPYGTPPLPCAEGNNLRSNFLHQT